jgi:hypothetical protein
MSDIVMDYEIWDDKKYKKYLSADLPDEYFLIYNGIGRPCHLVASYRLQELDRWHFLRVVTMLSTKLNEITN